MRRLAILLAPILLLAAGSPTAAQDPYAPEYTPAEAERIAELKAQQVRFMWRGAQRRFARARLNAQEKLRERARILALPPVPGRAPDARAVRMAMGSGRRPAPVELPGPEGRPLASRIAPPLGVSAIAANVIANNRGSDVQAGSGQCEVSIAAHGNNVVAAWNDGEGFALNPSQTQGFAYSTNNGATWVDGGFPPTTNVREWTSDPVIAVNEKTGAFYFAALCNPTSSTNGVGVVRGTFGGGTFSWGTPRVVISGSNSTEIYDKEWIAADSLTGNLYVIYAKFTASGNEIQFSRNTADNAAAWSAPVKLSATGDDGRVQGARVATGPGGEVWTTWNAIGTGALDFMRVRRAASGGTLFGAEVTAVSQYTNWGSGAPGFNRETGFAFPGLAVDRSTGPHRGRAYLAWNESVNFYNDNFPNPSNVFVSESEANNTPATADAFTMGQNLVGTISTTADFDFWSFSGTQGQTVICELDSVFTTTLNAGFNLICSDGTTRLGFSTSGVGGFNNASALIVFTLPATGTYYLRVFSYNDGFNPPGTGSYRIRTVLNGAVAERGRDHRDVFVATSDNGTSWSTPARVNGEPARYEDWLPEVAIGANGHAFVQWYDWRDAPAALCAGASMIYLSRSTDGGVTWPDGSPVTSVATNWSTTITNIIPNQGDYTGLFANATAVYSAWADGRNGDPDVFIAVVNPAFTATQVSLVATHAEPGLVRIIWHAAGTATRYTAYRREADGNWSALGDLAPDGSGRITLEDRGVTAGMRYVYRVGVHEPEGEVFTAEVAVDVPLALAFGIQGVHPNPTAGDVWVSYALPAGGPATLELIDVAGRRVASLDVSGPGAARVALARGATLPAGVYVVRLAQDGRSATSRVSVVR